jgi:outer membrane protein assembly factor BamB
MRLTAGVAFVVAAAACVRVVAQTSLDYPQWRGPQRDGSAAGFIVPESWPQALTRRWSVEVGEGYATPLVIGDTVYAFSRRADAEGISALDANTGALRWRAEYPAPYTPSAPTTGHGTGPKATPTFCDGKLFTVGITGVVSAFDATRGVRLWHTPSPVEPPYFSAASSPLCAGGQVLTHPGNYEPLTAFDVNTGDVRWSVGDRGFFGSPILAKISGSLQVVTPTVDSVIGVALDGRLLWRHPWNGSGGSTTPVLSEDLLIVSALDSGVVGLRPVSRDGQWSVHTVWATNAVSLYLSNPVVAAGVLFGLSTRQRGQFFALDATTGETLWLGPPRAAANSSLVKATDVLFLMNDDGELIVARASRTQLEALARYRVAEDRTWAQPAISGQRIFVRDTTSLTLWTL